MSYCVFMKWTSYYVYFILCVPYMYEGMGMYGDVCMSSSSLAMWPSWCPHHQSPLWNKHPTLSPTDANPATVSPRWGTSTVLCWKCASGLHLSWHVWLEASQDMHMFEAPLQAFASDNHPVFLLIILHLWAWMSSPMPECRFFVFWGDLSIHKHIKYSFSAKMIPRQPIVLAAVHRFHHLARPLKQTPSLWS